MKTSIIVRDLHTTSEHGDCYLRFERMSDMVLHEVDGKVYFSNQKYIDDPSYKGEILYLRLDTSNSTSHIVDLGGDYDVEVTNVVLRLRHEKKIAR